MASDVVQVWHDFVPGVYPLEPMLRRATGLEVRAIREGSRLKPLTHLALSRHVEAAAPCRLFLARSALLLGGAAGTERLRSVAPVGHPVLMVLRQAERAAKKAERAEGGTATPAAVTARVVPMLTAMRPSFPFVSLQAGFYVATGRAKPGGAPLRLDLVPLVIERLGDAVQPVLLDFPDVLAQGMRTALTGAGFAVIASPLEAPGPAPDLAGALRGWRDRLPAPLFNALCEGNAADLVLLDGVAARHAERMGLTDAQRKAVEAALGEAAEVTGHRRRQPAAAVRRPGPPGRSAPGARGNRLTGTIEPDPLLGWRNRPHAAFAMTVLKRRVVHETDALGRRIVVGQPARGERTLAIYGCSNPFGWAVPAGESFPSMLQAAWPRWRVENHGVNGYGSVHCLLELERDLAAGAAPDYATFTWSTEHRIRNVADVAFVLSRTPREAIPDERNIRLHTPRATLDETGELRFTQVRLPRPDLLGVDLGDFAADPYYLDLIAFKLIERAARRVREAGGHFFLTVLRTPPSPLLIRWFADAGIPVVTILLPSPAYTNLPDDSHANAAGNALYADGISAYLRAAEAAASPALAGAA